MQIPHMRTRTQGGEIVASPGSEGECAPPGQAVAVAEAEPGTLDSRAVLRLRLSHFLSGRLITCLLPARAERGTIYVTTNLKDQRDRFVAFAFAAADLLVEVGADDRITFAAGAAQRLLGSGAQSHVGRSILDLFPVSEHALLAAILIDRRSHGRFGPINVMVNREGRAPGSALLSGCRLPGRDDALFIAMSLPSLVPNATADAYADRRDAQTGLLDPESFAKLSAENIRLAREIGQEVKLTFIDMSGLEEMRAQTGENPTAAFLKEVGGLLRTRSVGNTTARLSDDKYGLLHDAIVDTAGLQQRIADLAHEAAPGIAEIGVRGSTLDADDAGDEAEVARALIYSMNCFVTGGAARFDITSMTGAVKAMVDDTLNRVSSFKDTVSRRDMQLRFQPIVDLKRRQPHHYEVLVRFDGDKSPYEIIKFAESMHIVHEMDLAICQTAIEYLEKEATAQPSLRIAVNLSAQSLENAIFAARLHALVKQHRALARQLIFEITESTELQDIQAANKIIQELRDLGHEMCLDDFGAGFASFQYLHGLHVDYVKLDGKYIRPILDSPRDRVMLKAMVGLCRDLGTRTVAEMIETETQAGMLTSIGVDFGQGWLFGKPAPAPEVPSAVMKRLRAAGMAGR